ncbi:T-cell surface antigen CD2-like [Oreochromis aureus]|uniref:T-cell surface antigen CD2-like n=1 Tax=Oreochromis aureus TaxID=47969 RepID=UPI001953DCB6|nr:T-cell surface antigen CD2-like [Oreochromis aureus]
MISFKTTEHRYLFLSNGTFRINNLSRSDSDNYTLQTFDSDGRRSDERILQLFIQAPVSSVLLVSECLSQGEMRVSCSSEGGDSPQYSWTLDGRKLTDAELLSVNNETNIITLKQHISGRLVCSVRNNVSDVSKEERISTCGAGILPLMGGVLSALIIFLVVAVAVICSRRKKQKNKPTKQEEDDQAIMFTDVSLTQQQGKQVVQRGEMEVEPE